MSVSLALRDRSTSECDSGYASTDSSHTNLSEVFFTKPHLKFINAQLAKLSPQDILRWCLASLPSLYQETAFGLTGLVTVDMLSKLSGPLAPEVDLIFIDTLYHFDETLDLVKRVQSQYPETRLHTYKPKGVGNASEFEAKFGRNLWQSNEELYDYSVKVEPSERAFAELGVKAVLTGRRRNQGAARKGLDIVEIDDQGIIKVNPLANWNFQDVKHYVEENNVPYNALLDQGYKSIGDWHSTQPVSDDEEERAGRWKGREKTECGIHNPKSRYAQFLMEQAKKEQAQAAQLEKAS
ncbi:MAG: hypothetical protein Q9162_006868 [Coniocarpon cinnabarinum]